MLMYEHKDKNLNCLLKKKKKRFELKILTHEQKTSSFMGIKMVVFET